MPEQVTRTDDAETTGEADEIAELELISPEFDDDGALPERFSYARHNLSPPLLWSGVPEEAAELVLLCEDIDAPIGTFVHWVVKDIEPDVDGVDEADMPRGGIAGRNGFGAPGWSGPHPPAGDDPHRYLFQVYAVDRSLRLRMDANAADVRTAMAGHVLARGTLVGRFAR
ncbi:YbhB/YbcL family Raf kinase inhibitor-like protein [Haloechinothrix salitolerans]|uniref:YbhB/YbcL family Raf kinase inhibitor-like protein n=1 Tax=Haloechinothrix salitolerans TaxID=926830 RepID=A0ABW2C5Y7_9PSEU